MALFKLHTYKCCFIYFFANIYSTNVYLYEFTLLFFGRSFTLIYFLLYFYNDLQFILGYMVIKVPLFLFFQNILRQSKLRSISKSDTKLHEMNRLNCNGKSMYIRFSHCLIALPRPQSRIKFGCRVGACGMV